MKPLFTISSVAILFLANSTFLKNSIPDLEYESLNYTPYQVMVWEIKANEGYESWWYKDGIVNGKQSYAIGFGWNDQGSSKRRKEITGYTQDGKVTPDEALQITLYEIEKYGRLHADALKNNALRLYSYSRGLIKTNERLGGCCGYRHGCGSNNKNVKKVHQRRRKLELAMWNHDYNTINIMTTENLKKIKKMNLE